MDHKKVDLYFGDCLARVKIELHEQDCFSLCLTEYQKNEEKSTPDNEYFEKRFDTEVFLGDSEMRSILKALLFILDQNKDGDDW